MPEDGQVPRKSVIADKQIRHSGHAKHDPESRTSNACWIPAFAGMTIKNAPGREPLGRFVSVPDRSAGGNFF